MCMYHTYIHNNIQISQNQILIITDQQLLTLYGYEYKKQ